MTSPIASRFAEALCRKVFRGRVPPSSEDARVLYACRVVFHLDEYEAAVEERFGFELCAALDVLRHREHVH